MRTDPLAQFEAAYALLAPAEQELMDNSNYPYIYFKAFNYLEIGAEAYRKDDFFGQPKSNNKEELLVIKNACKQVLACKGLTDAAPFSEIGITGFYQLMGLFHYESVKKKSRYGFNWNEQRGILDAITFQHAVDKTELTLYNFVSSSSELD
jgi:hypothetical protein